MDPGVSFETVINDGCDRHANLISKWNGHIFIRYSVAVGSMKLWVIYFVIKRFLTVRTYVTAMNSLVENAINFYAEQGCVFLLSLLS